ncbi:MAG: bacteriohemerythrin [Spirochaetaceae bacterium]|jgi:hemerythrin|nr:bacteriohemerythrin [Spirochaetaceae bacterium]
MFTLSKDMETGVEKIDSQHRELINRINRLLAAGDNTTSEAETRKTIDYLGEYVVKHFGDEEELQIISKYPKYAEHKEKHAIFINDFSKMKSEFMGKSDSFEFSMKLNNSLISWIEKHIKGDDAEFGKYYKAQTL